MGSMLKFGPPENVVVSTHQMYSMRLVTKGHIMLLQLKYLTFTFVRVFDRSIMRLSLLQHYFPSTQDALSQDIFDKQCPRRCVRKNITSPFEKDVLNSSAVCGPHPTQVTQNLTYSCFI